MAPIRGKVYTKSLMYIANIIKGQATIPLSLLP